MARRHILCLLTLLTAILAANSYANIDQTYTVHYVSDIIEVDGKIGDWPQGLEPIVLADEKYIHSDPWNGPEDLSANVYLGWNEEALFIAIITQDDIHDQPYQNSRTWSQIFAGDSVQLAFDPLRDRRVGSYAKDDHEYGFALLKKRTVVWSWQVPEGREKGIVETMPLAIIRDEESKRTIYEAKIAWSQLSPFQFAEGAKLGFSLLVNDNDGGGRKGWVELTSGIGVAKDPSSFADLLLKR